MLASDLVQELIDAGIHFGHKASRWNPKMAPYIHGKRNTVHIIDLRETVRGLLRAKKFISRVISEGGDVLFVGTKRQAKHSIQDCAVKTGMHYVNERWLGGTLTNFRTIRSRLSRLDELEQLEESGLLQTESKKTQSRLAREKKKITRNLSGIRKMVKLPGAVFVVDARHEFIAIREANKLGIPTVCLLDTDSDPDLVDIPIPGNDDAMRGIALVLDQMAEAIEDGKNLRPDLEAEASSGQPRKRSRRPTTSQLVSDTLEEPGPAPEVEGSEQSPVGALAESAPSAPEPSANDRSTG